MQTTRDAKDHEGCPAASFVESSFVTRRARCGGNLVSASEWGTPVMRYCLIQLRQACSLRRK